MAWPTRVWAPIQLSDSARPDSICSAMAAATQGNTGNRIGVAMATTPMNSSTRRVPSRSISGEASSMIAHNGMMTPTM